jgi:glycerophosphoryl diester phosphodiesterase
MNIVGHRGARGLAPENTLAGFRTAIKAGVDWIEFDVRATSDGRVVVIHDSNTLRIGNKLKRVKSTSYNTLKQIKIFDSHTIPTLAEAINAIDGRAKVNIEIKSTNCAQAVVNVIQRQIKKGANYNDFLVSSFNAKYLREVHYLNSRIQLGLLHGGRNSKFLKLRGLRVQAVGFHRRVLTKSIIHQAKLRQLKVYAYTVNKLRDAQKLAAKGVDEIVTDRPDLMQLLRTKD